MPKFIYRNIQIGTVGSGSVVATGDNILAGVESYMKGNDGFGELLQCGPRVTENQSIVQDSDILDGATYRNES